MTERNFDRLLRAQWDDGKFLCVGLDTDPVKVPEAVRRQHPRDHDAVFHFNRRIVEATMDVAGAYKLNTGFSEAAGTDGIVALQRTIGFIQYAAPQIPAIGDGKRGDIGNSNDQNAAYMFGYLKVDAATVHGYLGEDSLRPFLDYGEPGEKGVFVLCKTSNKGAGEFQDVLVDDIRMFQYVARRVANVWNSTAMRGLVVGATYPDDMRLVRIEAPSSPILIPAYGSQGGPLKPSVLNGMDAKKKGFLVNEARSVIYASGGDDFAEAAHARAVQTHTAIQEILAAA